MRIIENIDGTIEKIETGLVVILFSGIIFLVCFNILTRNLLNASFQTVFEIAPAMVLWLALIGSSLALKHRKHIRIELLLRYLPTRLRRWAAVVSGLFGMSVMGLLLAASYEFVRSETELFGIWGLAAVVFPIFFALSSFRYALSILDALLNHNMQT